MNIEFRNLTFCYEGKKSVTALRDVNAVIGPGIHLLLGENGAGKTTLLHLVDGLRFPTEGRCTIDGGPTRYRLPSVLSKIFYLEAGMPMPGRTVAEMMKIHACFYPGFSADMLADNLAEFELNPDIRFDAMSMGMRQKASVAYALALRTPILLLDEPATGLDISAIKCLQRMMARCIDPDQTVIVATHHIADLEPFFDSVLLLRKGRLLLADAVDAIGKRLAFVSADRADAAGVVLYTMPSLGRQRCIIANDGTFETDIDFELLYMGLNDDFSASKILNVLK